MLQRLPRPGADFQDGNPSLILKAGLKNMH